jgi:phosphoribosylamine--glycine ligase
LTPDLTVVGPEAPLVDGVVDRFRHARIEDRRPGRGTPRASKAARVFAKNFLARKEEFPTAEFVTAKTRPMRVIGELDRFGYPVVLKADGLAAGKGVIVAHDAAPRRKRRSATP